MDDPDPISGVVHEPAEAEAPTAETQPPQAQNALGAREFVSDRDALEDAWANSRDRSARDEGW